MKLTYLGNTYECVSAVKKSNEIIIHTGEIKDDKEVIYHIYGDIDFEFVTIEGGQWTKEVTEADRIAELEEALNMLLNGVTE